MSTPCGIAIKTEKGYETIYVHNDGSPRYMWPMLTKNYNSEEKAKELVSLGDASWIAESLKPTRYHHSFDTPEKGVCIFYHRDRDEDWCDVAPTAYPTIKDAADCFYYLYIWDNGCWRCYYQGKRLYY